MSMRAISEIRLGMIHPQAPFWNNFGRSLFDQVFEARKVFAEDQRALAYLIVAVWVAYGTLIYHGITATTRTTVDVTLSGAVAVIILAFVIFYATAKKAAASYSFYAASVIHAAIEFRAHGLGSCHEWLTNVEEYIRELDFLGITATPLDWKDKVRDRWTDVGQFNLVNERIARGGWNADFWNWINLACRNWIVSLLPNSDRVRNHVNPGIHKLAGEAQERMSVLLRKPEADEKFDGGVSILLLESAPDSRESISWRAHDGLNLLQVANLVIAWCRFFAVVAFFVPIVLYFFSNLPTAKKEKEAVQVELCISNRIFQESVNEDDQPQDPAVHDPPANPSPVNPLGDSPADDSPANDSPTDDGPADAQHPANSN